MHVTGSLTAKWTDRTNPLDQHMETMMKARGVTSAPFAPQMFGNAGREHMDKYGTTKEQIAKIAYKNHKNSVNNVSFIFKCINRTAILSI